MGSRNQLENYVYSMKNQLSDSEKGVADKIGDDDKEAIEKALEEANEWLDDNQEAEKEDFEEKLKEVQDICSPIISKVYKESGGAPGAVTSAVMTIWMAMTSSDRKTVSAL